MDLILIVFIIINIIIIICDMKIDKKNDELFKKITDLNIRLISERNTVRNILIKAEITKENYFETIEKIKKELDVSKTY